MHSILDFVVLVVGAAVVAGIAIFVINQFLEIFDHKDPWND
jgi:hypothetical protein